MADAYTQWGGKRCEPELSEAHASGQLEDRGWARRWRTSRTKVAAWSGLVTQPELSISSKSCFGLWTTAQTNRNAAMQTTRRVRKTPDAVKTVTTKEKSGSPVAFRTRGRRFHRHCLPPYFVGQISDMSTTCRADGRRQSMQRK